MHLPSKSDETCNWITFFNISVVESLLSWEWERNHSVLESFLFPRLHINVLKRCRHPSGKFMLTNTDVVIIKWFVIVIILWFLSEWNDISNCSKFFFSFFKLTNKAWLLELLQHYEELYLFCPLWTATEIHGKFSLFVQAYHLINWLIESNFSN